MIVVSTPRYAVVHSAFSKASVGTKYGVETISSRCAANIRASNISGIAEWRTVGPVPMTWAGTPAEAEIGSGVLRQSMRSSGTYVIQSLANKNWFWRATGPSKRMTASTQGAYFFFTRNSGSAQFWLPQYVIRSSMTTILR